MNHFKTILFLIFILFINRVYTLKNLSLKLNKVATYISKKASSKSSSHTNQFREFCWKDTYSRGVGKIPTECPPDREKIGLLCYSKCPAGYERFGFDCHQICPSDWKDQGLFCRDAEYGRGAGYIGKTRCENAQGIDNCEKNLLLYYPKCRPGYKNAGCCICRPDVVPDCKALGYNKGIDLSCAKKIIIGDPKPMICKEGMINNAGLCYEKCKSGFTGIAMICWMNGPPEGSGWVNCGAGLAKDKLTCGTIIAGQVTSGLTLAYNVLTFGMGIITTKAVKTASVAADAKEYSDIIKKLKDFYDSNKSLINKAKDAQSITKTAKNMLNVFKEHIEIDGQWDEVAIEDIIRTVAEFISVIDPTGIADVVAGFTYPKCKKYFVS